MRLIIPILVGATIGYITNWIAIKMLFRPHYEKRIFNIHIPFTPGLIPKERNRIAKSIGEAVGVYLLSPEVVVKSLSKGDENYIKKIMESYIKKLKQKESSLKDLFTKMEFEDYNKLLNIIKVKITDTICCQIRKENFKQKLIQLIDEYIFINSKDQIYHIINEKIELLLHQIATSEEITIELKNVITEKLKELTTDERKLHEIIPDYIICSVKNLIIEHDEEIVDALRNMLDNPVVQLRIKGWIQHIVTNNINKLVALFINPETISDRVFYLIKDSLDKPEINNDFVTIIINLIDNILESKVESIFIRVSTNISEEEVLKFSKAIIQYTLKEENQKKIVNILDKELKLKESNIRNKVLNFMSKEIDVFLNSQILYDNIFYIIDDNIERFMKNSISSLVSKIDERTISKFVRFLNAISNKFVKNKLPNIVQKFNISKVVEDQINSYDVAFAEKLILEIAHKELKAITWLGALLGGLMGMLSPILQMI